MLGKLVPCGGGAPIPLVKATLVVGRSPDCDLTIACQSVSGRHCELQFQQGFWWVRDLDSKNGTTVNGVRREKQRVAPNEVLSIGRQRFVVVYQSAEKSSRPSAVNDVSESLAFDLLTGGDISNVVASSMPAPSSPIKPSAPSPSRRPTDTAVLGKLIPCGGGDPITLIHPELIVGRNRDCDVSLRFPDVSGTHCKLTWQDGYWFVLDLNSSNGTWVNGNRCQKKCLLPECVLALAKHRFTVQYTLSGEHPPPEERENPFAQSLLEKAGLTKHFSDGRLTTRWRDGDDPDRRQRYTLD